MTQHLVDNGNANDVTTRWQYLGTGEVTAIVQSASAGGVSARTVQYDTLGRMVSQTEPNTGTWTYAYNDNGELVGLSDARGCGEIRYDDALGRLLAEDYSPCDSTQPTHTSPTLSTGDGTEAFYTYNGYGRVAQEYDRAQKANYSYDGRARLTRVQRQIATPTGGSVLSSRYAPHVFTKSFTSYDEANRLLVSTTGTDLPDLQVNGLSTVTVAYLAQGALASATSSYGSLIASQAIDASGGVTQRQYGDAAHTTAQMGYDGNEALTAYSLSRATPSVTYTHGSAPTAADFTQQTVLTNQAISYDMVGNPMSVQQKPGLGIQTVAAVNPNEWPSGAQPIVSRGFSYYADYRLATASAQYPGTGGDDAFTSAFTSDEQLYSRYPAQVSVPQGKRVRQQSFGYDWRGNMTSSTDDENVFLDRSIGVPGPSTGRDGFTFSNINAASAAASYDAAGNMVSLITSGVNVGNYTYTWDELGRLSQAQRNLNNQAFDTENYAYDADGNRVDVYRQHSVIGLESDFTYTINVFDSLVLKNASFPDANGDYEHDDATEHLYLNAAGELLGHVFDAQASLPSAAGNVHMFMPLSDRLGSTSFVIDHDTGELVEAATYQPYGQVDSDYRPARWNSDREDVRYTGQWDDSEVGLVYMNARYYSPQLGQFISPDPLTIHGLAGDPNPYAYVRGSPMHYTDPTGLNIFSTIAGIVGGLIGGGGGGSPCDTCTSSGSGDSDKGGSLPSSAAPNTYGTETIIDPFVGNAADDVSAGTGGGSDGPQPPAGPPAAPEGPGASQSGWSAQSPGLGPQPQPQAGGSNLAFPPAVPHGYKAPQNRGQAAVEGAAEGLAAGVALAVGIDWLGPALSAALDWLGGAAAEGAAAEGEAAGQAANVTQKLFNTANHIFGPKSLAKHGLGGVLNTFGGDSVAATQALEAAAQQLANQGAIQGIFQTTVGVGGEIVTVQGNVIDGIVNLSTAFIPPIP